MYYYIEVFDDRLEITQFAPSDGWLESVVILQCSYLNWSDLIATGVFDSGIPVHISPDLFSDAGIENTEWQVENLYE